MLAVSARLLGLGALFVLYPASIAAGARAALLAGMRAIRDGAVVVRSGGGRVRAAFIRKVAVPGVIFFRCIDMRKSNGIAIDRASTAAYFVALVT